MKIIIVPPLVVIAFYYLLPLRDWTEYLAVYAGALTTQVILHLLGQKFR